MLESILEDKEEMYIHVMRWVNMSIYDSNKNGDNMISGKDEWWNKSQPSLSKGH